MLRSSLIAPQSDPIPWREQGRPRPRPPSHGPYAMRRGNQAGSRARRARHTGHVTVAFGGSAQLDPAPGSAAQRAGRQCGVTAWKTGACLFGICPPLRSATNTRVRRTMAFWGKDMGACSLSIPTMHGAARVEQPGLPSASGGRCGVWQLRRRRPAAGWPAAGQVAGPGGTSLLVVQQRAAGRVHTMGQGQGSSGRVSV